MRNLRAAEKNLKIILEIREADNAADMSRGKDSVMCSAVTAWENRKGERRLTRKIALKPVSKINAFMLHLSAAAAISAIFIARDHRGDHDRPL